MLQLKKCSKCNTILTTMAKNPYCQNCIKHICVMSHDINIHGNKHCNVTVDPIVRDGKVYCVGHYKKALQHCRSCIRLRQPKEQLSFDGWYYCFKCKPTFQNHKNFLHDYFDDTLNHDTVEEIIKHIKRLNEQCIYNHNDRAFEEEYRLTFRNESNS
tara:strand:- start:319 stop:789 length:471 start_codon:yes stop_codon:yes gene_type:complete